MLTPIRVIAKSILVCPASVQADRCFVVVYVNGRLDASYPPRPQAEAIQLAEALAANDSLQR